MSAESGSNFENIAHVTDKMMSYLNAGYQHTDVQFNLSPPSLGPNNAYDIVNPVDKKRLYVTEAGNAESEEIVAGILGEHAVFKVLERTDDYAVYEVPRGSRKLSRTLKAGPYVRPYMQSLSIRSLRFLNQLASIDETRLGIDIDTIALSHNGHDEDDDNVFFTVIPPLGAIQNPRLEQKGVKQFIREEKMKRNLGKHAVGRFAPATLEELANDALNQKRPIDIRLIRKYFEDMPKGPRDGKS